MCKTTEFKDSDITQIILSTVIQKWLENFSEPLDFAVNQYTEHEAQGQWTLQQLWTSAQF